jgi:superfamily II DNA helicase RecQ
MQIKFITIPITDVERGTADLNKFLRANKIIEFEKELVKTETGAYWCVYINYAEPLPGQTPAGTPLPAKDYKAMLSAAEFEVFTALREIRKQLAKADSVPAYSVFLDAELAEIVKLPAITEQDIKKIKGIGTKRAEKYGKPLAEAYHKLK